MSVKDRFLRYVRVDTGSSEKSGTHPSTRKQWDLAKLLVQELRELGVEDARADDNCYVYGSVPANVKGAPAIGLIAHMDTSPAVPTGPVRPTSLRYAGGEIRLESGATIDPALFPELRERVGKELIVTDGRTLLGADDKAGVAEIMQALEILQGNSALPHGRVAVAFTPDEEIGEGADLFDVKGFGADYAYTVDGGRMGEIEYENFNAASAVVKVKGFSIHPGSAKNRMKNACLMAMEFNELLPAWERPEHTEGYEGFFHLTEMRGETESAELNYIVRDHDREKFEEKKRRLERIAEFMNEKYGAGSFQLELRDGYYNMREMVETRMEIVERAKDALREQGVEPVCVPIRGGTDGSRLSFMGLICPNLCTGGYNGHAVTEYACVEEMETMVKALVSLVTAR